MFFSKIRLKILIDKEAYMLNDLLKDIEVISNSHGVETVVKQTVEVRRLLTSKFGEEISFFPSGKYRIVHASDINPCESVATLQGFGLREDDIVKLFRRLVRRKIQQKHENDTRLTMSKEEMIALLDKGPLPALYNAIFYTLYDSG